MQRVQDALAGHEGELAVILILDPVDLEAAEPDATDHGGELVRVAFEHGVAVTLVDRLVGPTVTVYRLQPGRGVAPAKVQGLVAAWSLAVGAPVRFAGAVGHALAVEVPNERRAVVQLASVMDMATEGDPELDGPSTGLVVPFGLDVAGNPVTVPLYRLPHVLVAGATGQGKSTWVNACLVSLLTQADRGQMRLVLIDPKQVELARYAHVGLLALPVATDADSARSALSWVVEEMERRYTAMREAGQVLTTEAPVVVVVDELADLMLDKATRTLIEPMLVRLASKGRAAGVHLILATQRPSVDVVTGILKANVPTRLAFAVASQTDSRVILDQNGAESLVGNGDGMVQLAGKLGVVRVQAPMVSDDEVVRAVAAHYQAPAAPAPPAVRDESTLDAARLDASIRADEARRLLADRTPAEAGMTRETASPDSLEDQLRTELLERTRRAKYHLEDRVTALEETVTALTNLVKALLEQRGSETS